MADKSAIEAIHRLSVENDRLRAEVEKLREEKIKKEIESKIMLGIAKPGLYMKNKDGSRTFIDIKDMKIQK